MQVNELVLSLPLRFRPEKWQGKPLTVNLLFAEPQALVCHVKVSQERCEVLEGNVPDADCTVRCSGQDYVKMELGEVNPQWALVNGKVKVSNLAVMLEFTKLFRRVNQNTPLTLSESTAAAKRPEPSGPLKGIRVLDLSRLLPGPLATLWMAEMGADVIKIEDPDSSDPMRQFMPIVNGKSVFFEALNRNKKGLALNLRSAEGKKELLKMLPNVDVLVEGFRPGVMQKMGLDYETCQAVSPKLVYVSISGFGQTGPMAHLAGHDLNYMAMSGMLGLVPKGVLPSFQAADIAGGAYAALSAVLAALLGQKSSGKGTHIDLSMTEAAMPMGILAQTQQTFEPGATFELSGAMPNYRTYLTCDNRYIALGALEPKFWERFCQKAQKPHLLNVYTFSLEEKEAATQEMEEFFAQKTKNEWEQWHHGEDFCLTPVLNWEEIQQHPHFLQRGIFATDGTLKNPFRFSNQTENPSWPAPEIGQHNDELLTPR